jgi:metal-responsive CopG/Arc/MetJ family transcriptional regulator
MKVKTSVTLSRDVLKQVDRLRATYGSRSAIVERAVR